MPGRNLQDESTYLVDVLQGKYYNPHNDFEGIGSHLPDLRNGEPLLNNVDELDSQLQGSIDLLAFDNHGGFHNGSGMVDPLSDSIDGLELQVVSSGGSSINLSPFDNHGDLHNGSGRVDPLSDSIDGLDSQLVGSGCFSTTLLQFDAHGEPSDGTGLDNPLFDNPYGLNTLFLSSCRSSINLPPFDAHGELADGMGLDSPEFNNLQGSDRQFHGSTSLPSFGSHDTHFDETGWPSLLSDNLEDPDWQSPGPANFSPFHSNNVSDDATSRLGLNEVEDPGFMNSHNEINFSNNVYESAMGQNVFEGYAMENENPGEHRQEGRSEARRFGSGQSDYSQQSSAYRASTPAQHTPSFLQPQDFGTVGSGQGDYTQHASAYGSYPSLQHAPSSEQAQDFENGQEDYAQQASTHGTATIPPTQHHATLPLGKGPQACKGCSKLRKKCVRGGLTETCKRCSRAGIVCENRIRKLRSTNGAATQTTVKPGTVFIPYNHLDEMSRVTKSRKPARVVKNRAVGAKSQI